MRAPPTKPNLGRTLGSIEVLNIMVSIVNCTLQPTQVSVKARKQGDSTHCGTFSWLTQDLVICILRYNLATNRDSPAILMTLWLSGRETQRRAVGEANPVVQCLKFNPLCRTVLCCLCRVVIYLPV